MRPCNTIFDVNATGGNTGYSFLRPRLLGGEPERITVIFLRDWSGNAHNVLVMPAAAVRSAY